MDWISPTDEELAAMTDEEILGPGIDIDNPFGPHDREYLADYYRVCLGSAPLGTVAAAIVDGRPIRGCWIDLEARRLHHLPSCRCLRRLT